MTDTRIVAITGGSGALGSAVAERLASDGYKVAIFDTERSKPRIEALVGKLGKERAVGFGGDFSQADVWEAALGATKAAFGAAPTHGALIAGGWGGGAPLHEAKDDVYRQMIEQNVDTAYRSLRALLPAMVARQAGSIVVVGSRAAPRPWTSAGAAAYAASKSAVVAMAQAVAEEVLASKVRINAILPSTMDTPVNRAAMPDADHSKWVSLPSAAGVIAFLLSEDSRDVSGAALPIYGRT